MPWNDYQEDVNPWPELADIDWTYVFNYVMDCKRSDITEIIALYKVGAYHTALCLGVFRLKNGSYMTIQAIRPYNAGPVIYSFHTSEEVAFNSMNATDRERLVPFTKTQENKNGDERFSSVAGMMK